jgi:hypothetical protein
VPTETCTSLDIWARYGRYSNNILTTKLTESAFSYEVHFKCLLSCSSESSLFFIKKCKDCSIQKQFYLLFCMAGATCYLMYRNAYWRCLIAECRGECCGLRGTKQYMYSEKLRKLYSSPMRMKWAEHRAWVREMWTRHTYSTSAENLEGRRLLEKPRHRPVWGVTNAVRLKWRYNLRTCTVAYLYD